MKRNISEKKALKVLGIPDFRHMTKDKIVEFTSMLPYMDPEVATKALEQLPEFSNMASNILMQLKETSFQVFEENKHSQMAFYNSCNEIIHVLEDELKNNSLTSEDKKVITAQMLEVLKMIGDKDTENKKFLFELYKGAVCVGIAAIFVAFNLLGGNHTNFIGNDD